jgi:hypothetical protein
LKHNAGGENLTIFIYISALSELTQLHIGHGLKFCRLVKRMNTALIMSDCPEVDFFLANQPYSLSVQVPHIFKFPSQGHYYSISFH